MISEEQKTIYFTKIRNGHLQMMFLSDTYFNPTSNYFTSPHLLIWLESQESFDDFLIVGITLQ
jgi:hypothetical protein